MKKVLSIILSLCMLFSITVGMEIDAFAEFEVLQYQFDFSNNKAIVAGCNNIASGSIVIPSTRSGLTVREIGYEAFKNCSSITKITLPDTINSIGYSAFKGCSSLEKINIPEGVISIDSSAFYECYSLKSITIPGAKAIKDYTFNNCENLKTVKLGDNVTTIGNYAFSWCDNLKTVEFGTGIKTIGSFAFYQTPISDVYYPKSKSQWNKIVIASGNDALVNSVIHCSDGVINCDHRKEKTTVTKATYAKAGKYVKNCTICGATTYTEKLSKLTVPKITLSSVKSKKSKQITVAWKKNTKVTGYEIQYATNSGFTKNKKTVTVSKNSTTSKTISKLKGKTKYYVRIRAYKTENGKKYYSSWSSTKSVTTKK